MPPLPSVRLRLTLWYVSLLALILVGFSTGVYLMMRHNLYHNFDELSVWRANDLLSLVNFEEAGPTLPESISANTFERGEQFVRVYDAFGQLTFDVSRNGDTVPVNREAVQRALTGEAINRETEIHGLPFRVLTVPIWQDGRPSGVLEVGHASDDVSDILQSLILFLGIFCPVTLAIASLGGVFLAGRALSPVDRLTRLARVISAEDLSGRLNLTLPDDEVGRLARTFDEMIERLDNAFRLQRRFTADASHELKTPLTAIKGLVEVALTRPRQPEAYRDVLQAVNEEVDRLIRLVGSLLTLARAEAGQVSMVSEAVDLPDLVAGAIEQVRPAAEQRGIELVVNAGVPLTLQADEDLLLQLLLNLLDNAIKYTPAGGLVTAGWGMNGTQVSLWVRDTGVGIAPEHLPYIFDRFYRVDKARSRAEGGVGLGLSICHWIARSHGGSIVVESRPGHGSTFTVRLQTGN